MMNATYKFMVFKSKTTFKNIFRINDFEHVFVYKERLAVQKYLFKVNSKDIGITSSNRVRLLR